MKHDQHIAVEVRVDGEGILTLETSCLAGVPDIDQYDEELRWCAHHLLSFIGDPRPDASEAREADLKAKLEKAREALTFYADPYDYIDKHGLDETAPDFYDECGTGERAQALLQELSE